jgi:hypothetical protein
MTRNALLGLALLLAAAVWPAASSAQTIALDRSIAYAEPQSVPTRVREGCGLETRIPRYVEEYAASAQIEAAGSRRLALRIEEVHAPGGGMWTGPKWIELGGELRAAGRVVASFRARRASLGGPFAPFLDTCAILNRCARALGRDVAAWLADPTPDARLGDAR